MLNEKKKHRNLNKIEVNKPIFNKGIYFLITFSPTLFFIIYSISSNNTNYVWTIIRVIGILLIFFNVIIVASQLVASYLWLYSKHPSIVSIRPLEFFYFEKQRKSYKLSNQERAVHTLIGFALYILCFTNVYQYLYWSQSINNIQSFKRN